VRAFLASQMLEFFENRSQILRMFFQERFDPTFRMCGSLFVYIEFICGHLQLLRCVHANFMLSAIIWPLVTKSLTNRKN